jgi:His/Glu/Gln/Arg/opine family amino acid ABC transporter permease subunit
VSFDFSLLERNLDVLLDGLAMTCRLAVLSGILSLIGGTLLALLRAKAPPAAGRVVYAYVEVMRNTPLLITLYLIYFGLPMVGVVIPTFTSVVIALVMQHCVFVSEIIRGGFLSVAATQIEAGKALGMSGWEIFRIVQAPQILSTTLPALTGAAIILLHDTSLAAAISLVDLTMAAKVISQRTAASFEPFIAIAVCYSIISWAMSLLAGNLERRMQVAR